MGGRGGREDEDLTAPTSHEAGTCGSVRDLGDPQGD